MTQHTTYRIRRGPLSGYAVMIGVVQMPTDGWWQVELRAFDHMRHKPDQVFHHEFSHLVDAKNQYDRLVESAEEMSTGLHIDEVSAY